MGQKNFETNAIRTQSERTAMKEHSVPLYLTSSYRFDDAEEMRASFNDEIEHHMYGRFSGPNTDELIEKMCLLEEAESGYATSSGMAAIFATLTALLSSGDHLVVSRSIFGSVHNIILQDLPRFGIEHTFVDIDKPETWEAAIQENTKMLFLETPSNPGLDVVDLEWVGNLAEAHNIILAVDNCFATPYLQQPIKYGAHLCLHSATKFIDGQGRVLGGIVVGKADLIEKIYLYCRRTGPTMAPFNAWVLSKSLETLAVRMDRHCENALKLAQILEAHPDIETVKYPGLPSHPQYEIAKRQMRHGGGVVTFVVKGGLERGKKVLNNFEMATLTANLGDTRTIATHPASTTHSKLSEEERHAVGISDGLIRVSVGLEDIIDIIKDVEVALEKSK